MVAMFGSIIPLPLAVPPMTKAPAAVSTRTASSFGNGSVVISARATSLPLPGAMCAIAVRIPGVTFPCSG
jgi:hypothetical protein